MLLKNIFFASALKCWNWKQISMVHWSDSKEKCHLNKKEIMKYSKLYGWLLYSRSQQYETPCLINIHEKVVNVQQQSALEPS